MKELLVVTAVRTKQGKRLDTYELNTELGGVAINAGSMYLMKDIVAKYDVQIDVKEA